MSILDHTDNLIDLYVYAQGTSKIPRQYHMWAFISLIASCLQDRVWIEEIRGQPLFPNLYVILWGDSGSGKSVAIRSVFNLAIQDPDLGAFVNAQHGRGTFQSIADMMGKTNRRDEMGLPSYEQPKVWWTMDELANDVGDGARANDFIKGVTELYYCPPRWTDQSRTYGVVSLTKPVFNWLAGSTPEWYAKTVKRDGVEGGFQPRTITVQGTVDYNPGSGREWPPVYPKDRDEVMEVVQRRLRWLCHLPILANDGENAQYASKSGTGQFTLHDEVASKLKEWTYNRKGPDEGLEAYWNQEGVKLRKLMMVLSVAERYDLVIMPSHWVRAQKMVKQVEVTVPTLLKANYGSEYGTSTALQKVAAVIHRRKLIKHAQLLSLLSSKNVRLDDVKSCRKHLYDMGKIDFYVGAEKDGVPDLEPLRPEQVDHVRRGLWYRWRTGEALPGK